MTGRLLETGGPSARQAAETGDRCDTDVTGGHSARQAAETGVRCDTDVTGGHSARRAARHRRQAAHTAGRWQTDGRADRSASVGTDEKCHCL